MTATYLFWLLGIDGTTAMLIESAVLAIAAVALGIAFRRPARLRTAGLRAAPAAGHAD
jgi:hypothetical protein